MPAKATVQEKQDRQRLSAMRIYSCTSPLARLRLAALPGDALPLALREGFRPGRTADLAALATEFGGSRRETNCRYVLAATFRACHWMSPKVMLSDQAPV